MLNYVLVPTSVLASLRGYSRAFHVFFCLAAHRNTRTNRTHFMSKPRVADLSGISRRHIYHVLAVLESKGLIEAVAERRGEYMWFLPSLVNAGEASDAELDEKIADMMRQMEGLSNG